MRWDPHISPPGLQPRRAVLYAATDLTTAAAEVWQASRLIDPHTGTPIVAKFTPTVPLRLLNLTAGGQWAIRNGASAALATAPRDVCRAWARAILDAQPDLDGLLVPSTLSGTNVVLYPAGARAIPIRADLLASFSDPATLTLLDVIARSIGYAMDSLPTR